MLMGLGSAGEMLAYQEDFHTHCDQPFHLFGPIMEAIPYKDHFSYIILIDMINNDVRWAQHSSEQQSHIILALLSTTIFANLGNCDHFYYLITLVELNKVNPELGSSYIFHPYS